jgi:hypothetical protein
VRSSGVLIRLTLSAALCASTAACQRKGTGADGGGSSDGGACTASCDAGLPAADAAATDANAPGDAGPDPFAGTVLFTEPFEDGAFASRGWYDEATPVLSTVEHIPGGTSSWECTFQTGATGCTGGTPGRHLFADTTSVYLSYWVKYSANYVGSGLPYHPHEFHFITNEDGMWIGPAITHLTTYIEQSGGVPRLALQDSLNVDLNCILLNNDSFIGCNGDYATYPFTEMRSACSCNGLLGDLDGRDCFDYGGGLYYSARTWDATVQVFGDAAPYDRNAWHFIEAYFRLNDITGGVGVPNGVLRYWFDGQEVIAHDAVLLRTGAHPTMMFDQFLTAPYIGDGSPVTQTMWIDDLTVATGRP